MRLLKCDSCKMKCSTLKEIKKHGCDRNCSKCGGCFATLHEAREHTWPTTRIWVQARLRKEARKAKITKV